MWAGLAVGLVAVVLGFVKSGDCGSVFQPRDSSHDTVNTLLGSPPPDCTQALDLTVPVIVLAVVAGLLRQVLGRGGHTLRHRYATTVYAGTGDLRAVQELLGHASPVTTARYTLVSPKRLREAAAFAA